MYIVHENIGDAGRALNQSHLSRTVQIDSISRHFFPIISNWKNLLVSMVHTKQMQPFKDEALSTKLDVLLTSNKYKVTRIYFWWILN